MKRLIQFRTRPETDKPEGYQRSIAGRVLAVAAPLAVVGGAYAYSRAGSKAKMAARAERNASMAAAKQSKIFRKVEKAVDTGKASRFTGPMQGPPQPIGPRASTYAEKRQIAGNRIQAKKNAFVGPRTPKGWTPPAPPPSPAKVARKQKIAAAVKKPVAQMNQGVIAATNKERLPIASIAAPGEVLSSYQAERRRKVAIKDRDRVEKAVNAGKASLIPARPKVKSKAEVASDEVMARAKKSKTAQKVQVGFAARLLLVGFQRQYSDGTFSESINPLSAYRKASRVVPWARRASEAAGDVGDIASGKKVEKPFYKKNWFKNAALATAVAAPVFGAKLHRVGTRLASEGKLGDSTADEVLRRAAKSKTLAKIADYAFSAKPNKLLVALNAHARLIELARREDEKPRNRWVAPALVGAAGLGAAGGAYLGTRKISKSLGEVGAAASALKTSAHKIGGLADSVTQSKGKTWLRRRLGFGAKLEFATVDPLEKGWDLRDARGRSARVYAPGSKRRERREKDWGEKTSNIRAVRNAALLGVAGLGTLAVYQGRQMSKLKRAQVKPAPAAGSMSHDDFRRMAKQA